jgi:hypothetical protein
VVNLVQTLRFRAEKTFFFGTSGWRKRVAPEFCLSHFFQFSLYLDGTKWVCTARDVPGTKTSGRNGKMWKGENSGATRFLQPAVFD